MFDRWDRHYGFSNIAVVATNIDHHDLLHSIQDSAWVARAHQKEGGISAEPSKYLGGQNFDMCRRSSDYDDQFVEVYDSYSALAFKAPGMKHLSEWAAAKTVVAALRIAATRILVNSYARKGNDVFYKAYKENGLIGLITHGATASQLKAFKTTLNSLRGISAEDLESFKKAAKLEICTAYDTRAGTQAMLLDTFTASGFPCDCPELVAAIEEVQTSDIQSLVDSMFSSPATLVHHGDSPACPVLSDFM
jgi:hypothetical protein